MAAAAVPMASTITRIFCAPLRAVGLPAVTTAGSGQLLAFIEALRAAAPAVKSVIPLSCAAGDGKVVILERNRSVARRAARHFATIGATTTLVEDPAAVVAALPGASLLCSDACDGDLVVELLRNRPSVRGLLWTAEPIKHSLRLMHDCPAISHVLARKDTESLPRPWELLMAARRILHGDGAPPFAAYLDWGAQLMSLSVRTTADADRAVDEVQEFIVRTQTSKRVSEMFGELAMSC